MSVIVNSVTIVLLGLSLLFAISGEVTTCIGCHENSTNLTVVMPAMQALEHPASSITPVEDIPEIFDYLQDIG